MDQDDVAFLGAGRPHEVSGVGEVVEEGVGVYRVSADNSVRELGRLEDFTYMDGADEERAKAEALLVVSETRSTLS